MKVDTRPFSGVIMVEGHRDTGERLHDVDWIFRSMSTWQVHYDAAMRRRGLVPAIGLRKAKKVYHRRTSETHAVSVASLCASAQEI
jgi:hypothetical protein